MSRITRAQSSEGSLARASGEELALVEDRARIGLGQEFLQPTSHDLVIVHQEDVHDLSTAAVERGTRTPQPLL